MPAASHTSASLKELTELDDDAVVRIWYTNHRGERGQRRILPSRLWFGRAQRHPEAQWVLDAWDLDKGAIRSFALRDVENWAGGPLMARTPQKEDISGGVHDHEEGG